MNAADCTAVPSPLAPGYASLSGDQATSAAQPLIGREAELRALRGLVARAARDGVGGVAFVTGEPGIGKSALLTAALADARRLGCTVLRAVGDELLGNRFPLATMLDCLRPHWDPPDAQDGVGPSPYLATMAIRLLGQVRGLCERGPVVLAIDDMQWADSESIIAWHRLASAAARLPLLVIGASRPGPYRQELARARAAALRRGGTLIDLAPLTVEEAVALAARLARATGRPADTADGAAFAAQLAALAGGNPRYLGDIAQTLARDPDGETIPGIITERLGFLPARVRDALRRAALLDERFSATELAIATSRPAGEVVTALETATAVGILAVDDTKLAFRHPVVRQALREATPAAMRDGLHLAAARSLAVADAPPEQVAAQLIAASDIRYGWVGEWLGRTAPALARQAPQVAARLLDKALAQLPADTPSRGQMVRSLLTALFLLDKHEELVTQAQRALASASELSHAAEISWHLAHGLGQCGRHEEACLVLARILSRRLTLSPLDEVMSARLYALRASIEAEAGQMEAAEAHAGEAITEARRVEDPPALAYARYALAVAVAARGDYASGLRLTNQAIELTSAEDETAGLRLRLLSSKIALLDELDDAGAAETTTAALSLAEEVPGSSASQARARAAAHLFRSGRWTQAVTELDRAADVPGVPLAPWAHALRFLIAAHGDDDAHAQASIAAAELLTLSPDREHAAFVTAARSLAAERDGRPGDAVRELAAALAAERGPGGDSGQFWWLPRLVRLALAAGDRQTAEAAARAAEEDGHDWASAAHLAAAEHCRGLLTDDPALLLAAVERYRRAEVPLLLAIVLEDVAVAIAARGDLGQARAAHTEAARLYTVLGAVWDLRRADARLRAYGVRRGSRSLKHRASSGWDALTPTEVTVARLVAEGRSNPEIAAELFLSRATIKTHISRILRKLGAATRAEIAREAASR